MWPSVKGSFAVLVCMQAISLICQSLMSSGLGEIGTKSSMLLQIKDMTALRERSHQKTGKNTRYPQAQGGHLSRGVRSRAL